MPYAIIHGKVAFRVDYRAAYFVVVGVVQYDEAAERQSGMKKSAGDKSPSESSAGLTAGVVVGVLAAVLLVTGLIVAAVYLRRRRRQRSTTVAGIPQTFVLVQLRFSGFPDQGVFYTPRG